MQRKWEAYIILSDAIFLPIFRFMKFEAGSYIINNTANEKDNRRLNAYLYEQR